MSEPAAALRAERSTVLEFCADLTPEEWIAPSAAAGWSVRDVLAHMTVTAKAMFVPHRAAAILFSRDLEDTNEKLLSRYASADQERVLTDYAVWSRRLVTLLASTQVPGLSAVRIPLGELGRYPYGALPSIFLFDWHTHLRHDIAPGIGRTPPSTDGDRMSLVVAWILRSVEQMNRPDMTWMDEAVSLALTGPGGGSWTVSHLGAGRLTISESDGISTTHIVGAAADLPKWATTRTPWRDCTVTIHGNTERGQRFLDSINIV